MDLPPPPRLQCVYCKKNNSIKVHCRKCGASYCSTDCRIEDWDRHAEYCLSKQREAKAAAERKANKILAEEKKKEDNKLKRERTREAKENEAMTAEDDEEKRRDDATDRYFREARNDDSGVVLLPFLERRRGNFDFYSKGLKPINDKFDEILTKLFTQKGTFSIEDYDKYNNIIIFYRFTINYNRIIGV